MFDIELQTIHSGYDRKTCWVHARPGAIPGDPPIVVVTMHKLRLSGSDVYYEINDMRSDDGGKTWTGPVPHKEAFGRRLVEHGIEEGVSDFWPQWHAKSGVLLGTGHTVRYKDDDLQPHPRPRDAVYSVYDPAKRTWKARRKLEMPDPQKYIMAGAGSTQRVDLPDGDILLPISFSLPETAQDVFYSQHIATVFRCGFDGETLRYVDHGTELTVPGGRGFGEPSLARAGGRYYLTLRNNDTGYVTAGDDGLHFEEARPWTFENETWVVVPEWMQTNPPDPFDCTVCEKYGSDNSIFLARIRFNS